MMLDGMRRHGFHVSLGSFMDARVGEGSAFSAVADAALNCAIEFDTASIPAKERIKSFRDWHSSVVDVRLIAGDAETFKVTEKVWKLGDIALAVIDASAEHLLRWETEMKPAVDSWMVTVHACATSRQRIHITCLTEPDTFESEGKVAALFVPSAALGATSQPHIASDTGEFLADYLTLLQRNLGSLSASSAAGIGQATIRMLLAAVSPTTERMAHVQAPIDAVMATRTIRAINANLADPELGPHQLCKSVGVSRSRLYRIFEPTGGIANYIRRRRLMEVRRALTDSANMNSIAHIAETMGFTDPSGFSRMFRREFGMSPKEVREHGSQMKWRPGFADREKTSRGDRTLLAFLTANSLGIR